MITTKKQKNGMIIKERRLQRLNSIHRMAADQPIQKTAWKVQEYKEKEEGENGGEKLYSTT